MAIKVNPARRAFVVFNYVFCILVGLLCVIPVLHILAVSLSGKDAIIGSRVILWPVDTNFDNYRILLRDGQFFRSFRLTILRAVAGWCVSMIATVLASYPLSMKKSQFPARQAFVVYFMIIMLFNGGMIPTYLVIKDIGLLDTLCQTAAFAWANARKHADLLRTAVFFGLYQRSAARRQHARGSQKPELVN